MRYIAVVPLYLNSKNLSLMRTMTIGRKISSICIALVALTIFGGAITLTSLRGISRSADAITMDSLPGTYSIGQLAITVQDVRSNILLHLATTDPAIRSNAESAIAADSKVFDEGLIAYQKTITTARDRELYGRIPPAYEKFKQAWEKVRPLSQTGDKGAVGRWVNEGRPAVLALLQTLQDEIDFNKTNGDRNAQIITASVSQSQTWTWIVLLLSLAAGSGLSFFVIRSINSVLLRSVVELSQGSEQVASASSQVSSSSQSLAQGASEQAASLEETSASSEEVASMTQRNAENSSESARLMLVVEKHVSAANVNLEELVLSMESIKTASDSISKIIKVIDGIAFQTNILALNAAVEAARAGEAGMGFSVVADEVRSLAQRAAQAAKDTTELIQTSVDKSEEGNRKLVQVSESIKSITESASRVKTLVDEVNLGSQEQARGVDQIAKAVSQMQQVTQQTAASAEEGAAAGEELNAQAASMRDVVVRLRCLVDSSSTQPSAAPAKINQINAAPARSTRANAVALKTAINKFSPEKDKVYQPSPGASHAIPLEDEFREF